MKKIILVNIFLFFILAVVIEFFSLLIAIKVSYDNSTDDGILKRYRTEAPWKAPFLSYFQSPFFSYEHSKEKLRKIQGKEYKKNPILLFGCSVAYGNLLDDDNNFSGILSRITQRPVYNMAYDGWGPAHMLKLLNDDRSLLFLKDPEYVIYTFIKDHKRRLITAQGWPYSSQLYKIYDVDRNGNLYAIPRKYPFYWRFLTTKHIQYAVERYILKDERCVDDILFKVFEQSSKILKSRYPNAKLIILLYDVKICINKNDVEIFPSENVLTVKEQEVLTKMGFEIYNMEELAGKSFCSKDYHAHCPIYGDVDYNHPSSKMWEEFIPKLVEKLKM